MANISKPVPAILLNRDRQLLTRFQERRIRSIFPFLALPPELRNVIYRLCLSFKGVETFFDDYYRKLAHSADVSLVSVPLHPKRTPAVLLLCRQIYSEAIVHLQKKQVSFHHGLFDIQGIQQLISHEALRSIASINITVKGHPILQKNILRCSWMGYMDLFADLALVLEKDHKLKNLVIDFRDPNGQLDVHTHSCWNDNIGCDFRDGLKAALGKLHNIRGVGNVEILGIDSIAARELQARMQSTAKPVVFLDLPLEIRNRIYKYSASLSDVTTCLHKTMAGWRDHTQLPPYPPRLCPTILLLNKQITREACQIVYTAPLCISMPKLHSMNFQNALPNMLMFVTKRTLRKVQHLEIDLDHYDWMAGLIKLLEALGRKHNLQSFSFQFKNNIKHGFLSTAMEERRKHLHLVLLQKTLAALKSIRGVEKVTIGGDITTESMLVLQQVMHSPVDNADLLPSQAAAGNGFSGAATTEA